VGFVGIVRCGIGVGIALVIGLGTRMGSAADIDTITVTDAGPSKTIPTDAAVYIGGSVAKNVVAVRVLIVRTGSPYIFHSHGESCATVIARLGNEIVGGDARVRDTRPGDTTSDQNWVHGDRDWDVRVSAPWTPSPEAKPDDKGIPFRVLIDRDTSFFSAGHSYCFFVYQDEEKQAPDPALADTVLQVIVRYADCLKRGNEPGCAIDRAAAERLLAEAKMSDAARAEASAAVRKAYRTAYDFATRSQRARAILRDWAPAVMRRATIPSSAAITADPLARAAFDLLQKHQKASIDKPARSPERLLYGKTPVTALGFAGDSVVLTSPSNPAPVAPAESTAALRVPGTQISLQDLLELARGRLPLGDEYLEPGSYAQRLATVFDSASRDFTKAEEATYQSASTSLHALDDALNVILGFAPPPAAPAAPGAPAAPATPAPSPIDDQIRSELRAWLDPLAIRCDPGRASAWTPDTLCTSGPGWRSYNSEMGTPLSLLIYNLDSFHQAHATWLKDRPEVQRTIVTTRLNSKPFGVNVEMTRETWAFSYVSPVVGYAISLPSRAGQRETLGMHYFAAQLHVRPNPAHLPEKDLGILAFEVGISPGIGSFGPDNRFRGVWGLSPLFFGLAIHLIPYTSFSGGLVVAENRSTTLSQESYHTYWGGYFGLTVDFNIPELVLSQTKQTTVTSAAKP
jgi:hypothetical protein